MEKSQRSGTLDRRQFLRGVGAVTIAAAIPAAYAGNSDSGTITGRLYQEWKKYRIGAMYGMRGGGKSRLIEFEVYRHCLANPEREVLYVRPEGRQWLMTVHYGLGVRYGQTYLRVYSGLCIWPMADSGPLESPQTQVAVTQLRMDQISDQQLDEYLESGLWKGKAGAFGYQDRSGWLHIVEGSESNVIGLPLELLDQMLPPKIERFRV